MLLGIKFLSTSNVISPNQAKNPYILLNNKLLHMPLPIKYPPVMKSFVYFLAWHVLHKIANLCKWITVKITAFMNCKTNTIIIIDCQPFQPCLSLVLLQTYITLRTFPIPTLARPQTTSASTIKFFFWASSSNHYLAALDLGAGSEQPFSCLIIQNHQAKQSMRSMDWTLEDNMVDGFFFYMPY